MKQMFHWVVKINSYFPVHECIRFQELISVTSMVLHPCLLGFHLAVRCGTEGVSILEVLVF